MNDFSTLEKTIVRELSCRLCLCNDIIKLKPLSAETKRKIKNLFNIVIRTDDNLPKAICHDCLQQVASLHLYSVKVEKTQKFLEFHKIKREEQEHLHPAPEKKMHPIIKALSSQNIQNDNKEVLVEPKSKSTPSERQRSESPTKHKKKSPVEMKFMEAMPLEEFAKAERVDTSLLVHSPKPVKSIRSRQSPTRVVPKKVSEEINSINTCDTLDPIVLIDGRPAKQGAELDKQITLFYKMECCICHGKGFDYRSLMKHYKERHGVPGYVTCCDKKFHYFYPKKIIEHMAYHLQPNIFMCKSCHRNFQTSNELIEHETNGGRTEGRLNCPHCEERFPTYRELGQHIITHRTDKSQCDYCAKVLKHHHRKKTINHMEDLILCSHCLRSLRSIEKQEKESKDKVKVKSSDTTKAEKYRKFYKALEISCDDDYSTE
ncbi:PREDICTED: PR domain zinc finger protein 10-like [Papilio polytes]|uniref:PR domain zinc finger protein 10-like n=1 Tax=Papilio polytes TaxID=76194 RepID=UPI000675E7BB|nr:PREDICTED: PR domain zinc finger protein 10-like [Papilio polytes]